MQVVFYLYVTSTAVSFLPVACQSDPSPGRKLAGRALPIALFTGQQERTGGLVMEQIFLNSLSRNSVHYNQGCRCIQKKSILDCSINRAPSEIQMALSVSRRPQLSTYDRNDTAIGIKINILIAGSKNRQQKNKNYQASF